MNSRSLILLSLLLAAAVTPACAAPTFACYASLSATAPCIGQAGCDTTTYFQVNSYSTGAARPGALPLDLSDFVLEKPVDQNSVALFADMLLGTKIPAITMVCIQTDHRQSFTFLQIQLQDVAVISDQVDDASKRKTESTESVGLMPGIFSVTVNTPATDGSPASSSGYTYDVATKSLTSNG
jgi:type VI protein secretion system component Hcp